MTAVMKPEEATGFDVDYLDQIPDDGNRYQLMEGALVVNPPPSLDHQKMSGRLFRLLAAACPGHLDVVAAPFGLRISDTTEVQPDLAIIAAELFTGPRLETPPLLVAEILSPSTARHDQTIKSDLYATFGIPTFLVIGLTPPSITEYVLDDEDGVYALAQRVPAGKRFEMTSPVTVAFDPAELLA